MVKPGFEEIALDLSHVPTVEQGLADAAERYVRLSELAAESMRLEWGTAVLHDHLPLMSFINRATSLHAGVVKAVETSNPHAAFTLLRAYLELVALIYYVDAHPDYIEALQKPMAELPRGTRKRFAELFDFAAKEFTGIGHVYAVLNEMAHFGSTALWHPFSVDETRATEGSLGVMSYRTGPHWRDPDEDPRTALAMLEEADRATVALIRRFDEHHIRPVLERYAEQRPGSVRNSQAGALSGIYPNEETNRRVLEDEREDWS